MPIYEYMCDACGHRSEVLQRVSDDPLRECGECGGEVRRLISAPAVQFKGSGWYVTDYAGRKSADGAASGSESASGAADGTAKSEKAESPASSKASE